MDAANCLIELGGVDGSKYKEKVENSCAKRESIFISNVDVPMLYWHRRDLANRREKYTGKFAAAGGKHCSELHLSSSSSERNFDCSATALAIIAECGVDMFTREFSGKKYTYTEFTCGNVLDSAFIERISPLPKVESNSQIFGFTLQQVNEDKNLNKIEDAYNSINRLAQMTYADMIRSTQLIEPDAEGNIHIPVGYFFSFVWSYYVYPRARITTTLAEVLG